jgi:hypothetical protein
MKKKLLINKSKQKLILNKHINNEQIIFYSANNNGFGSCYMRGYQVYQELKKYHNCYCTTNISNIKNSIIIFIKNNFNLDLKLLIMSKNNNNINIIDIVDYVDVDPNDEKIYDEPDFNKNNYNNFIDAYIVNNKIMESEYIKKYNKFSYVIPHHYDPRLNKIQNKKSNNLKFLFNGYLGHTNNNCLYVNELRQNLENFFISDGLENFLIDNNIHDCCHISIRKTNSWEYRTKPAMKLAHASGINCNIITSNDDSVKDILPENYPYLLKDDSYESLIDMINYVKETYNTPVWMKGLEIMDTIKNKLMLENIVKNYYCPFIEIIKKEQFYKKITSNKKNLVSNKQKSSEKITLNKQNLIDNFIKYNEKLIDLCLCNKNIEAYDLAQSSDFKSIINDIYNINNYKMMCSIVKLISEKYSIYTFEKIPILFNFNEEKLINIQNELLKNGNYIHDEYLDETLINNILLNLNNKNYNTNHTIINISDIYSVKPGRYEINNQADLLQLIDIQKIVTDPFILNVCQNYLGVNPILAQTNFWITNGSEVGFLDQTHQWHQDYDDIKFLKIFIYFNDVDLNNGPHCYVKESINNIITPNNYQPSDRLPNDFIINNYNKNQISIITGKKGTIIFENTNGFHKGHKVLKNYRFILQLEYISSLSFLNYYKPLIVQKNESTKIIYDFKEKYPLCSMLFTE